MTDEPPLSVVELRKLREYIDRQEIWHCLLRYTRGIDRMDEVLIRSAFWADAHIVQGVTAGTVDDFLAAWHPAQRGRDLGLHVVSNQTVNFDDRTSAHVETYYIATVKHTARDELAILGGRFIERYEKRGHEDTAEWRIAERLALRDWQVSGDASRMQESLAQRHRGARSTEDPSYERPLQRRDAIRPPG